MNKEVSEIRYFFYSQAFADGVRTTLAILLPSLVASYFHVFEIGLTISLGALCVSVADLPGPYVHKRNAMLICSGFLFIVALLTVFARLHDGTMLLEILVASFFFSMFNVYGNRATSVGSAALLLLILMMDKPIDPARALPTALLIGAGSIFYLVLSLLLYKLRPYRIAERALGENIREIAKYLSIKADFYNISTDLENDYKKLVAQQIVVHEKQDLVRELLFKTRQIINESTSAGRKLVLVFTETVDLFEVITASYYDYNLLRDHFGQSETLTKICLLIKKMARELDQIGIAIQTNSIYKSTLDPGVEIAQLKKEIDLEEKDSHAIILKRILVNLRSLFTGFHAISQYFEAKDMKGATLDHSQFIAHQPLDPVLFWNNFSLQSSVFRHALRVTLACFVGYIIGKFVSSGHHNYWILMTIVFMLKPAFSLTKQRNFQRIAGTLIGGVIGIFILIYLPGRDLEFFLLVLFMLGTYSFIRINYLVAVVCITPYILILFKFLGLSFLNVAADRILDTIIGCVIAFAAGYLLFPSWESAQIKTYLQQMVRANMNYLLKIGEGLKGKPIDLLQYKLARKEVYVASANLSAAFQRMISEPKSKQANEKEMHQLVVLNHILFSNIATVATSLLTKPMEVYSAEAVRILDKILSQLSESLKQLGSPADSLSNLPEQRREASTQTGPYTPILKEQLEFICKVSKDIEKVTAKVNWK